MATTQQFAALLAASLEQGAPVDGETLVVRTCEIVAADGTRLYFSDAPYATGPSDTPANTIFAPVLHFPDLVFDALSVLSRGQGEDDRSPGGSVLQVGQIVIERGDDEFSQVSGIVDGTYYLGGAEIILKGGAPSWSYDAATEPSFAPLACAKVDSIEWDKFRITIRCRSALLDLDRPLLGSVYGGFGGALVFDSQSPAGTGYLVNQGDHAVGDTDVALDTGTGSIVNGDKFTVAGDATIYEVTDASGAPTYVYTPAARTAFPDDAAVTFKPPTEVDLGDVHNAGFRSNTWRLRFSAPASEGAIQVLWGKRTAVDSGTAAGWNVYRDAGDVLMAEVSDGTTRIEISVGAANAYFDDLPHTLEVTLDRDADELIAYVDGEQVGSAVSVLALSDFSVPISNTASCRFGRKSDAATNRFQGELWEAAFFNRAREDWKIEGSHDRALTGGEDGLEGWYDFSEYGGGTLFQVGPQLVHQGLAATVGEAGDILDRGANDSFTICAVYSSPTGGSAADRLILGRRAGTDFTDAGYGLSMRFQGFLYFELSDGTNQLTAASTVGGAETAFARTPVAVAGVVDRSNQTMRLLYQDRIGGTIATIFEHTNVSVGSLSNANSFNSHRMDDVSEASFPGRLYLAFALGRAATNDEIQGLINNGIDPLNPPQGLEWYSNFDDGAGDAGGTEPQQPVQTLTRVDPDEDVNNADGWKRSTGQEDSIYTEIDDGASASDADFIESPLTANFSKYIAGFGAVSPAGDGLTTVTIRYRWTTAGNPADKKPKAILYDGGTLLKQWTLSPSTNYRTDNLTLSQALAASPDLRVEIRIPKADSAVSRRIRVSWLKIDVPTTYTPPDPEDDQEAGFVVTDPVWVSLDGDITGGEWVSTLEGYAEIAGAPKQLAYGTFAGAPLVQLDPLAGAMGLGTPAHVSVDPIRSIDEIRHKGVPLTPGAPPNDYETDTAQGVVTFHAFFPITELTADGEGIKATGVKLLSDRASIIEDLLINRGAGLSEIDLDESSLDRLRTEQPETVGLVIGANFSLLGEALSYLVQPRAVYGVSIGARFRVGVLRDLTDDEVVAAYAAGDYAGISRVASLPSPYTVRIGYRRQWKVVTDFLAAASLSTIQAESEPFRWAEATDRRRLTTYPDARVAIYRSPTHYAADAHREATSLLSLLPGSAWRVTGISRGAFEADLDDVVTVQSDIEPHFVTAKRALVLGYTYRQRPNQDLLVWTPEGS